MASVECGFTSVPGGATAAQLLTAQGPTLLVDIGFDPAFVVGGTATTGIQGVQALVDSGAGQSCIDSLLAAQLNLPIVNRQDVSGAHGAQQVNMHLAQVYVPTLKVTIHGVFAGVHLAAGGQVHQALIGRTFLSHFKMVYDGPAGRVTITS